MSVFTTQPTPPINLRAKQVKSELEETKALRARLESREADIRELKMTLRTKQEEFGELQVRKDLAEKRLANTSREDKMANEKLEVCFKFLISLHLCISFRVSFLGLLISPLCIHYSLRSHFEPPIYVFIVRDILRQI